MRMVASLRECKGGLVLGFAESYCDSFILVKHIRVSP